MKKTFFYNFFPSKEEEETCKVNNIPRVVTRELVEIRDIYPAPKIDLTNPQKIKKNITHNEVIVGKVEIPFFEMFEYILRYWKMDITKFLVDGYGVYVAVWDVTQENNPKKYEGENVFLKKLYNDNYSLSIMELFNDRKLAVGDEIGLYWDLRSSSLMFKLISQVCSQ
ncbi:unnamed protein product [Withania somnifera]